MLCNFLVIWPDFLLWVTCACAYKKVPAVWSTHGVVVKPEVCCGTSVVLLMVLGPLPAVDKLW